MDIRFSDVWDGSAVQRLAAGRRLDGRKAESAEQRKQAGTALAREL